MDTFIPYATILFLVGGLFFFIRNLSGITWKTSRYALLGMFVFGILITVMMLSGYKHDLFLFFPVYYLFFIYTLFNEKNQDDLKKSGDMYKLLMDNSDEIICQFDISGKLLFANKTTTRLLEYDAGELQKISLKRVFSSRDLMTILKKVRRMSVNQKPASLKVRARSKSGSEFYLNSVMIPVLENGKIMLFRSWLMMRPTK